MGLARSRLPITISLAQVGGDGDAAIYACTSTPAATSAACIAGAGITATATDSDEQHVGALSRALPYRRRHDLRQWIRAADLRR